MYFFPKVVFTLQYLKLIYEGKDKYEDSTASQVRTKRLC